LAPSTIPATMMEDDVTTTQPGDEAKREREVTDAVDQIRRLLIDCTVQEKRLVLIEVDKWVSLEEASDQTQQ
jgi:hypothetical protein